MLLGVVAVLDVVGVLDLIELATLELFTLDAADVVGVEEVAPPHKVPFTLGAPAVPFAWKPKLADAFGASVAFQLKDAAV